jgi:NitT/TauT family transport system permease protein
MSELQATSSADAAGRLDRARLKPAQTQTVRVLTGAADNSPRLRRLTSVAVVVVLLAAWEAVVRLGWQSAFWVSRPSLIAAKIGDWFGDGTLQQNLLPTLQVALLSFLISGVAALVIAAVMHWSRWLDDVFGWYLNLIYAIPKPALIPLLIFAFGLGSTADYILVVAFVFFVFYFNIRGGLAISRTQYENALLILGGKRKDVWLHVTIPSLVPFLVASARFGIPLAILGTVFAEFFTTSPGMGRLIVNAQYILDSTTMMAAVVILIIVGAVFDEGLRFLDRRVSRWRI